MRAGEGSEVKIANVIWLDAFVEKLTVKHRKTKHTDPIPDEFASYEEAGQFWDTHAITDYPETLRVVKSDSRSQQRGTTARKVTTTNAAERQRRVKTARKT